MGVRGWPGSIRLFAGVCLMGLMILAGCGSPRADGIRSWDGLLPSLQAYSAGNEVTLVLQVTNTTGRPVDLNFSSGQQFDFWIEGEGRELWRWSDDQMFTQALYHLPLAAGETLRYEATWEPPASAHGDFTAYGTVTSRDHPIEQRVEFTLP